MENALDLAIDNRHQKGIVLFWHIHVSIQMQTNNKLSTIILLASEQISSMTKLFHKLRFVQIPFSVQLYGLERERD